MNDSVPLFSIVIPTYNRANFIARAINSVLEQTFNDWELIVVDDGSTDGTKEVVYPFLSNKISYFYQQNKELSAARNAGIRLSKGKYICFLDDDDYYLDNHLQTLAEYIIDKKYPVAIFRTGTFLKVAQRVKKFPNFDTSSGMHPVQFVYQNPVNLLSIATHKDIFDKFTFPEQFKLFEDAHFLLQALLDFPFFQIDDYTVMYNSHQQMRTITYFQDEQKANHELECILHLFKHGDPRLHNYITSSMQKEGIALHYLSRARKNFYKRDFMKGISFYGKALRTKVSIKIAYNYLYATALFFSLLIFRYPKLEGLKNNE